MATPFPPFAELPRSIARSLVVGLAELDTCASCRGKVMGWLFDGWSSPAAFASPADAAKLVPPVLCAPDTVRVGAFLVRFQAEQAVGLGRA